MRTLTMLRAWSLWINVVGAALLLAFSTFDPMIAALALSAVGVFVLHALLEMRAQDGSLPREFLDSFVPGLGVLVVVGANAVEAEVPQNATAKSYGPGWKCERGFRRAVDTCVAIAVPENGYLSESASSKQGWECERGLVKSGDGCLVVTVPVNTHLGHDGASRECDMPFRKRNGVCVEL